MGNLLSHVRFYDFSELAGCRYETLFDSIDGWTIELDGEGAVNMAGGQVNVQGGTSLGAYANLLKFMSFGHWSPSFNKKRLIRTMIEASIKALGDEDNYFITGFFPGAGDCFGFVFKLDRIQGISEHDGEQTLVDLVTGLEAPYSEAYLLEATFFPGVRIQFLVNGVWAANIDTNLPIGDDFSGVPLAFRVGKGGATSHNLSFSSALFFQDT